MGTILDFEVASRYPKQSQQKMKQLIKTVMPVMKQLRQSLYADAFLFPADFQEYHLTPTEEVWQTRAGSVSIVHAIQEDGSAAALLDSIRKDEKREHGRILQRTETLDFSKEIQKNRARQERKSQSRRQNKNEWKQWNKLHRHASQIQRQTAFKSSVEIGLKWLAEIDRQKADGSSGVLQTKKMRQEAGKRKDRKAVSNLENMDKEEFLLKSRPAMPEQRLAIIEKASARRYFSGNGKEVLETADQSLFQKTEVSGKTEGIAAESASTEAVLWKKRNVSGSTMNLGNRVAQLRNIAVQGRKGFGVEDRQMEKAGSTVSKRRIAVEPENMKWDAKNRELAVINQHDGEKAETGMETISTTDRRKARKSPIAMRVLPIMGRVKIWSNKEKSEIVTGVLPTADRAKQSQNAKQAELILNSARFASGMKQDIEIATDIKRLYAASGKSGQIQKMEPYAEKKNDIRSTEWLQLEQYATRKRQTVAARGDIGDADKNMNHTDRGLFRNIERTQKMQQGIPMKAIRNAGTKFYTETKPDFASVGGQRSFVRGLHNIDLKTSGMAYLDLDALFFPAFDVPVQDRRKKQERHDTKQRKDHGDYTLQSSLEEMKRMLLERIQEKENTWTMEQDALLTMSPFGFRDGF